MGSVRSVRAGFARKNLIDVRSPATYRSIVGDTSTVSSRPVLSIRAAGPFSIHMLLEDGAVFRSADAQRVATSFLGRVIARRLCLAAALRGVALPAAAQVAPGKPGPSFIFFRYATRTSLALYGGYGVGHWFGFLGLVQNPRTEYRESIAGIGRRIAQPRLGTVTIALAGADARDSRYAQLYVLPPLTASGVTLDGAVEVYAPLESRGVVQYDLNFLSLLTRISKRLQVGVTYLYFGQQHAPTAHGIGPALRVGVPNGTISVDLVRELKSFNKETRITFQTAF